MKIKVVSWNIWQDFYLEEVISFLKEANADIIGLQEIIEKNGKSTAQIIAEKLKYNVAYFRAIDKTRLGYPQGNAVLSKYPITESLPHMLSDASIFTGSAETEPRVAVEAKIAIGDTQVTAFATHLAYSHMFQNSEVRNNQVDNLIKLLPSTKTILFGDFNSHPDSLYMKKLNEVMSNTDKELTQPTWTMYPFDYEGFKETELRHRLDYIFVTRDIKVDSFKVEHSMGSDHLPISAIVEL